MTKINEDLHIYVACLASYNNGILHGRWIDAAQGVNGMQNAINAMLDASPIADAEEWAIHDYEGFGSIRLSEYAGLDTVAELAEFIEENSDLGIQTLLSDCVADGSSLHTAPAAQSKSSWHSCVQNEPSDAPNSTQRVGRPGIMGCTHTALSRHGWQKGTWA